MDNYDLQVDIAKGIFLAHDQAFLIRKFNLEADSRYIYLTYLNSPCRISRTTASVEKCPAATRLTPALAKAAIFFWA